MFLLCSLGHLLVSDNYILPIAQSSFSTSKTSLFTGRSKTNVSLLVEFVLPVTNWTLWTSPSSSLYVFSILAIGKLFWITSSVAKTISPTLKFCLVWLHFCLVWSVTNFFPKFVWEMLNTSPLLSTAHVVFLESTWWWHDYPCLRN